MVFIAIIPMAVQGEDILWNADNLPMTYLQDRTKYVCNPDGMLSAEAERRVNHALRTLEDSMTVQMIVVVVRHAEGGDAYQLGMNLARKYKIGRGDVSNGIILVLLTDDRSYHILTGYGMEGTLPDAICKRIENSVMLPPLKEGNWDEAITQTVSTICGYVKKDKSVISQLSDAEDDSDMGIAIGMFVVFIVIMIIATFLTEHKKCPRCGKRQLKVVRRTKRRMADGRVMIHTVYRCENCGNQSEDDMQTGGPHHDVNNIWILPGMFGGRGGGGFSGGGFGGGTFGGGGFGGGGAGGRF